MKILLYGYTSFLEPFLFNVEALSKIADVQAIIELAPENWSSALFDIPRRTLKPGLYEASQILGNNFPDSIKNYWKKCSSFHFYVFDNRRSLHPSTWRQAWSLMNILRTSKADIIHFNGISLRIAPFLWRLKKFPILFNVHDAEPHSGEDGWRRRLSARLIRKSVNHYIFHSNFCKDQFISQNDVRPEYTSMIPFGVFDIIRHWMISLVKEENNNVLFFGRLSPYKGLEVFLKAAPIVAQKIGNCNFVIAGKPIKNYTVSSLPDLPEGSKFTLKDEYITNLDLCKLMQQASIVVCPYIDASQSAVVLTAYAFNKPVIVTNVGGLPEYVEDGVTGLIVPPNDPDSFAKAVISLLSDGTLRRRMSREIESLRNSSLNWSDHTLALMNIYKKLVLEGNHK